MPSHLQGLNIVHPEEPQGANSDSDLLGGAGYPDFAAQLELWNSLAFPNEEPLGEDRYPKPDRYGKKVEELEEESAGPASRSGHENVVTGRDITTLQQPPATSFDFAQYLSSFGIDPFNMTQANPAVPPPSLMQLLSMHPSQGAPFTPSFAPATSAPSSVADSPPASKRARTRKASIVTEVESPIAEDDVNGTPMNASEDKRRRNTAASARFRLKKKEREQALETKSKELEARVADLERECEGLRRENGWLKGLVVGVTGATTAPQHHSIIPPSQGAAVGSKRGRD